MNFDDKNLEKKMKSRNDAFAKMNQKIDDKKVKELDRDIDYLNFFLSRKEKKSKAVK